MFTIPSHGWLFSHCFTYMNLLPPYRSSHELYVGYTPGDFNGLNKGHVHLELGFKSTY
jgi:hypothetical protein